MPILRNSVKDYLGHLHQDVKSVVIEGKGFLVTLSKCISPHQDELLDHLSSLAISVRKGLRHLKALGSVLGEDQEINELSTLWTQAPETKPLSFYEDNGVSGVIEGNCPSKKLVNTTPKSFPIVNGDIQGDEIAIEYHGDPLTLKRLKRSPVDPPKDLLEEK